LLSAANTLLLQPDGKLLVGGQFFTTNGPNQPRVVRYESTGAIDASFDNSVAFTTAPNLPDYTKVVTSLALQPDGKVVVGGSFGMVNSTVRLNLARLSATGLLDTGFVPPATSTGRVAALARQPNGRLLVASLNDLNGTTFGRPITRVLDTGATDPSFGATTTPDNSVLALLVQPDGAIVLGGSFTTIGGQPAGGVARLTAPNVLAVAAPAAGVARTQAWPVPAHSVLHVAPDASAQPRTIELVDALGRAVRTLALTSVATEFALSVDGLPAGLYLLRVTYAAGAVTRPVAVE
jgi:uncharacterized delta-60 repeat protein